MLDYVTYTILLSVGSGLRNFIASQKKLTTETISQVAVMFFTSKQILITVSEIPNKHVV